MKTSEKLALVLSAAILVAGLAMSPHAQTTYGESVAVFRGSDLATRKISVSSTTGTALWSADAKRPDSICFNNTASVVWIGTTSAAQHNQIHDNITGGFPLLSSGTIRLDGSMSGAGYATSDSGLGTLDVRCLDGITR